MVLNRMASQEERRRVTYFKSVFPLAYMVTFRQTQTHTHTLSRARDEMTCICAWILSSFFAFFMFQFIPFHFSLSCVCPLLISSSCLVCLSVSVSASPPSFPHLSLSLQIVQVLFSVSSDCPGSFSLSNGQNILSL